MMAKAWAEVGGELERKSAYYASRGYTSAARETMLRAVALFGRAQYSIFSNADPRKAALREHMDACMETYIELAEHPIERLVVPFAIAGTGGISIAADNDNSGAGDITTTSGISTTFGPILY